MSKQLVNKWQPTPQEHRAIMSPIVAYLARRHGQPLPQGRITLATFNDAMGDVRVIIEPHPNVMLPVYSDPAP